MAETTYNPNTKKGETIAQEWPQNHIAVEAKRLDGLNINDIDADEQKGKEKSDPRYQNFF